MQLTHAQAAIQNTNHEFNYLPGYHGIHAEEGGSMRGVTYFG